MQAARQSGRNLWQALLFGAERSLGLVFIGFVLMWRYGFAAFFPAACRFEPSCSAYALQAIRTQGAFRGGARAVWRILRCNPWGRGGYDPVPPPRRGPPAF